MQSHKNETKTNIKISNDTQRFIPHTYLPNDIVFVIFSHLFTNSGRLNLKEKRNVLLVSKMWNVMVNEFAKKAPLLFSSHEETKLLKGPKINEMGLYVLKEKLKKILPMPSFKSKLNVLSSPSESTITLTYKLLNSIKFKNPTVGFRFVILALANLQNHTKFNKATSKKLQKLDNDIITSFPNEIAFITEYVAVFKETMSYLNTMSLKYHSIKKANPTNYIEDIAFCIEQRMNLDIGTIHYHLNIDEYQQQILTELQNSNEDKLKDAFKNNDTATIIHSYKIQLIDLLIEKKIPILSLLPEIMKLHYNNEQIFAGQMEIMKFNESQKQTKKSNLSSPKH